MTLTSARRSSLVQQVIDQIDAQVTAGVWKVGERIPTEPQLAQQLGVGRNTVREAVRALTHAGVLHCRQGAGTFVLAANELSAAMARRLAAARIRDIVEVRRGLEVEAARLAAERRTARDLDAIDAALAAREQAWSAGRMEEFVEADATLHERIAAAAHNPLLGELYADFGRHLRVGVQEAVGDRMSADRYVDHGALCAAIRDGDPRTAAREASAHLDRTLGELG